MASNSRHWRLLSTTVPSLQISTQPKCAEGSRFVRKVPFVDSLQIISRGSLNWRAGRPICVSFEVTDSCTAHCRHCDHGGPRDNSKNLKPADYRRYMKALR